ncbi:hypothetical protein [Rhizobium sullae]|nr:hypothetical protein [Rhizobium sullae]
MLIGLAGNEYALSPGDERDFPQDEAIRLIEAGFALPVAEEEIERAVSEPAQERRGKKPKAREAGDVVSDENHGSGDQ